MRCSLLLLLFGCAHAPAMLPHEIAAGEAAKRAWAERGMPPPTALKRCAIDEYNVIVTHTPEELRKWCSTADPATTYGCLAWTSSNNWFFWRDRPLVVVAPMHHTEPTIVVHELMHAYIECAEIGNGPWDPGDRKHTNPRVWRAPGGEQSVQWLADELAKPSMP